MDPIELAFSIIGAIFILVYFILYVRLLNNRSEKGEKEFFTLPYQFGINWLLSPELYTEKGNRYRKIISAVLIVFIILFISLMIADAAITK